MKIELIYNEGCPHVTGARNLLAEVLKQRGESGDWREHCRQSPDVPADVLRYGSPTILVNGRDIVPETSGAGNACRLYRDEDGKMSGLPPRSRLEAALSTPGV